MWIKVFCIGCKWVLVLVWIGLEECLQKRKCSVFKGNAVKNLSKPLFLFCL